MSDVKKHISQSEIQNEVIDNQIEELSAEETEEVEGGAGFNGVCGSGSNGYCPKKAL